MASTCDNDNQLWDLHNGRQSFSTEQRREGVAHSSLRRIPSRFSLDVPKDVIVLVTFAAE
jgi:hypothetical protein